MTGELPWRSLTVLMYVHGCLATEMCGKKQNKTKQSILSNLSAPLSWRKFLRIPFWDLVMDPGLFS